MITDEYTPEQLAAITQYVDVQAHPPTASAHFIFGTNQALPVEIVASRYHQGLAPLIIATGGVNRHDGSIEGQEFRRRLIELGVPESVIRTEDRSVNTWQNVENALPFLHEALASGLPIVAVCKWYHRRAIHCLATLLPQFGYLYAITFEPTYAGTPITCANWTTHSVGGQKVIREWQEVSRRVAEGSYRELNRINGAWR